MNKTTGIIIITITIVAVMMLVLKRDSVDSNLVDPYLSKIMGEKTVETTPIISPTPKTFHFDSTTDLRKELDSVNPQVLDSDFEEL